MDEEGKCRAYLFFTFLYAPIFPISCVLFKRKITRSNIFQIEWEEKTAMKGADILLIYFKGWVFYPLLIFAPLLICIIEVYLWLGLPEAYHGYFFAFAIIYLITIIWILSDRYDALGLPKNYKKILRERAKK